MAHPLDERLFASNLWARRGRRRLAAMICHPEYSAGIAGNMKERQPAPVIETRIGRVGACRAFATIPRAEPCVPEPTQAEAPHWNS